MKESKRLHEERVGLYHRMQEIAGGASKEGRPMTPEEIAKFDAIEKDETVLKQRADEAEKLEAIDLALSRQDVVPRSEQVPEPVSGAIVAGVPELSANDRNEVFRSWAMGSKGTPTDHTEKAARAMGVNLRSEQRAMTMRPREVRLTPAGDVEYRNQDGSPMELRQQSTVLDGTGGELVPDEMMRALDIALLTFGGARQASSVVQTATGADMPFPTVNDTAVKGEIIDENAAANQGDVTFGQIVLGSFKYSSKIVLVSIELMQDSATNIPQLLGRLLGERIGRIQNDHFTVGAGTTLPFGMVTAAADSAVVAAGAAALTYDEIVDLYHSVDPAYRGAGAGFMMNDTTLSLVKKVVDGNGRLLWQGGLVPGQPNTILGSSYVINQSMASGADAKAMLYGQLNKYLIRDVLGFTLIRLDERYAEYGQIGFLAWARSDGNLIDAGTEPVKYLSMGAV